MIYDVRGKRGGPFPAGTNYTMDATGLVLSPCVWCDTETGECCRYVVYEDRTWEVDKDGLVKTMTGFYPAPLKRGVGTPPEGFKYAPFKGVVDKE